MGDPETSPADDHRPDLRRSEPPPPRGHGDGDEAVAEQGMSDIFTGAPDVPAGAASHFPAADPTAEANQEYVADSASGGAPSVFSTGLSVW
jgi:hypothetical protein